MIRRDGHRMILSGPVTLVNVAEVLLEGAALDEGLRAATRACAWSTSAG